MCIYSLQVGASAVDLASMLALPGMRRNHLIPACSIAVRAAAARLKLQMQKQQGSLVSCCRTVQQSESFCATVLRAVWWLLLQLCLRHAEDWQVHLSFRFPDISQVCCVIFPPRKIEPIATHAGALASSTCLVCGLHGVGMCDGAVCTIVGFNCCVCATACVIITRYSAAAAEWDVRQ